MELNKAFKRGMGLVRFHLVTLVKKKSIAVVGFLQYLGKGARLTTSGKGRMYLGRKMFISERCTISSQLNGELTIGNNNFFNSNTAIVCLDRITIGDDNLFAQNVVVVDHNHNYDSLDMPICKQGFKLNPVSIGSDCWICANVVICPGSEIGDHIVIASNSVVSGTLSEPGVYAGAPARLIKKRD